MKTIKHKTTGRVMEVSEEQWAGIQGRSRNWEVIKSSKARPAVKKKPEPEVAAAETEE